MTKMIGEGQISDHEIQAGMHAASFIVLQRLLELGILEAGFLSDRLDELTVNRDPAYPDQIPTMLNVADSFDIREKSTPRARKPDPNKAWNSELSLLSGAVYSLAEAYAATKKFGPEAPESLRQGREAFMMISVLSPHLNEDTPTALVTVFNEIFRDPEFQAGE
ncbi:MAG TPA: hypothetical protein VH234_01720 [Candidatus Saccharimonadales bacterium]|jgi:hypothetical protein|nr:hypothetical protein [Candidatus Saccharimonadales bacterium]